jgi:hypothetical protein
MHGRTTQHSSLHRNTLNGDDNTFLNKNNNNNNNTSSCIAPLPRSSSRSTPPPLSSRRWCRPSNPGRPLLCCLPGARLDILPLVCKKLTKTPSLLCLQKDYLVADLKKESPAKVQAALDKLACVCCDGSLSASLRPEYKIGQSRNALASLQCNAKDTTIISADLEFNGVCGGA